MHDSGLQPEEVARARSFALAHEGSVYVTQIAMMEEEEKDIEFFEVYATKDVDAAFQLATDMLHDVNHVRIESIDVDFWPEGL